MLRSRRAILAAALWGTSSEYTAIWLSAKPLALVSWAWSKNNSLAPVLRGEGGGEGPRCKCRSYFSAIPRATTNGDYSGLMGHAFKMPGAVFLVRTKDVMLGRILPA